MLSVRSSRSSSSPQLVAWGYDRRKKKKKHNVQGSNRSTIAGLLPSCQHRRVVIAVHVHTHTLLFAASYMHHIGVPCACNR
mmetsp:Transcript_27763/g.51826  ORF Transcript_27763/g.51826 Transcript_27763/m.51826 type:complete len:81 (-) Transcript_27763:108-350(-)